MASFYCILHMPVQFSVELADEAFECLDFPVSYLDYVPILRQLILELMVQDLLLSKYNLKYFVSFHDGVRTSY